MPEIILMKKQMYAADARMMESGVSGEMLMLNAAKAVSEKVLEQAPKTTLVFCGAGNNAGDGYACAWLLGIKGVSVKLIDLFGAPDCLPNDAKKHFEIARRCPGVSVSRARDTAALEAALRGLPRPDAIIDAIFGIGLSRPPEGVAEAAIRFMNDCGARVIAVDIPSGIDGDTGRALGEAVHAHETVTFQHAKTGHLLYPGREYTGELTVEPIGFVDMPGRCAERLAESDILDLLPARKRDAHKGESGKGLLVAGSDTMAGAAILSAKAALRSGIGLLTLALYDEKIAPSIRVAVPEAMISLLDQESLNTSLDEAMRGKTAIAAGPGMGRNKIVYDIVWHILKDTTLSLLLDADALNALGLLERLSPNVLVTPHPGEMARLSGLSVEDITENPLETARRFAREWNCNILLKGATSVIASHDGRLTLNTTGNPGLAKGGSGDVLSGIILALMCQGLSPYDAARCGAYLAGRSADIAKRNANERSMLASDVIENLVHALPKES